MNDKRKTFYVGRDAKTGHFIPVKEAERRPRETTVERVPKRGYGDTKDEPRLIGSIYKVRPLVFPAA